MANKNQNYNQENYFTIDKVVESLKENPNYTLCEIAKLWGFDGVARTTVNRWRKWGYITCDTMGNGDYSNVKVFEEAINNKNTRRELEKEEQLKLAEWKERNYIDDIDVLTRIINNHSTRSTDKMKAVELKHKALKHINSSKAYNYIITKGYDLDILLEDIQNYQGDQQK